MYNLGLQIPLLCDDQGQNDKYPHASPHFICKQEVQIQVDFPSLLQLIQ